MEYQSSIRNFNEDQLDRLYFDRFTTNRKKIVSAEGVPIIKLLLSNPERYASKSK